MKSIFLKTAAFSFAACLCAVSTDMYAQIDTIRLPPPYHSESVENYSKVLGWQGGRTPVAPAGFVVTKFAEGFHNPRNIYIAQNGDIFISDAATKPDGEVSADKAQSQNYGSADIIHMLRDADNDGVYESRYTYLSNLNQPFGMCVVGNHFYVANTDGLVRFPYEPGATLITAPAEKLVDLPAGGYNNHWTRNLIAHPNGSKIYISVGSASNNGEYGLDTEIRRANILEVNPDGTGEIIYAAGLRNPVGMGWNPATGDLWTVVNERDELGDDLVPDYATRVQQGGFYGWPYAYFGPIEDPRMTGMRPDLVARTLVPDIPFVSHTSSIGITFYTGNQFPERYRNGLFVAQRGSWNRSELSGYKVLFVPFNNGIPSGNPEDFLTGFISDRDNSEVYGRPTGLAVLPDGSLLVSDDASKTLWRVSRR